MKAKVYLCLLLVCIGGTVLSLLFIQTRTRMLRADLVKEQGTLKHAKAEARRTPIKDLEEKRDTRRKEVERFKSRCVEVTELARIERALCEVGPTHHLLNTDLGEYVRSTFRVERGEGPVSEWTSLADHLGAIMRTSGVVLRSFRVAAVGEAHERRLLSFNAELAVFTKPLEETSRR